MSELEALIDMLKKDLEWLREQENPENNLVHKQTRVMLTLAEEIHKIKFATKQETKEN